MIRDATRLSVRLRALLGRGRAVEREVPPGAVLGYTAQHRPVVWASPRPERAGHAVILGSSGAGKTIMCASALGREVIAEAEGDHGALTLFLIDLKGDLAAAVLQVLSATDPARLSDVRILDPFDVEGGFALNLNRMKLGKTPVDIRALQLAGLVGEVSTATGAQAHLGMGARQLDVLVNVLLGALTCPHPSANVLWAYDALTEKNGQKALAKLTTSERARGFLLSTKLSDELRISTASRLRTAFATSDHLERLISAEGCIDWSDLLAPGRIVIVDLGRPTGGLAALPRLYGNLLVRLAVDHLLERPSPFRGHAVRIAIDEAQVVASVLSDVAETILTRGRSLQLSLVCISQGTTLLRDASDTLLRVLLQNSPTKLIGRLATADAELLAKELTSKPGIDQPLSGVRSSFVAEATNLRDRHFIELTPGAQERFVSADVDIGAWQSAEEANGAALASARRALAVPSSGPRVTLSQAAGTRERARGRGDAKTGSALDEPLGTREPHAASDGTDEGGGEDAQRGRPPRSRWG